MRSSAAAAAPAAPAPPSAFARQLASLLQEETAIAHACAQLDVANSRGVVPGSRSVVAAQAALGVAVEAIKQRLQRIEVKCSVMRSEAADEPEMIEEEQQAKMNNIEKHAAIIEDLHGTLRTSLLRARAAVERAALDARQQLLASNDQEAIKRRAKAHAAETAAEKSAAFTQGLHRTRNMLSAEIARSSSALSTLTSSTGTLGAAGVELKGYEKTVKIGSKIITKQLQRERTDKILIMVGLCFFALVVMYIVNKRLTPFLFWWTHLFVSKTPAASVSPASSIPNVVYHAPSSTPQATVHKPVEPPVAAKPVPITPVPHAQTDDEELEAVIAAHKATKARVLAEQQREQAAGQHQYTVPAHPSEQQYANQFGHVGQQPTQQQPAPSRSVHDHAHPPQGHAHASHRHAEEHAHDHTHSHEDL